jgi:uncharacterized protein (TIGR02145 family)
VVNTTAIKSHELETPSKVVDADGNEYNTVRIRDKIWITENLKTKHFNDGQPIEQVEDFNSWLHLNTPAYCDPSKYYNVESDGLLYNHYVVQRGGVCPQGFQIPSEKVIDSLIDYYNHFSHGYLLGGLWTGPHSKRINFDDLNKQYENGTFDYPSSGFNFQDGAYRSGHKFYSDNDGYSDGLEAFWLKDKVSEFDDETQARAVQLYWWESSGESLRKENDEMNAGNYIRCYKEYSSVKNTEKPVNLVDKDGNTYKTVKIGNQIWMAEDLKVIPDGVRLVFNSEDLNHYWGAVCYDNFEKNGAITYSERSFYKYVENKFIEQDVCPQGWHLPDKGEWEMLLKYYSMNDLKSTTGWIYSSRINTYNKNGTNKSGLNLKPDKWQTIEKPRALYLFKDHLSNGTSTLKIDFYGHSFDAEKNYDENQGHVRCVKD